MLETRSIAKSFGGTPVLKDVSISVQSGEIVGLLGPNGSGKSTLLNIVSGFLPASGGEVAFNDRPIGGLAAHRVAATGMRRTFQLPQMPLHMSCAEVLLTAVPQPLGSSMIRLMTRPRAVATERREAQRRVREMLELLLLAPVADRPAALLSGGQQKLLALGAAVLGGAQMVLLDEPTAGVAPPLRRELVEMLKRFRDLGVTLLVVEHDMGFIGSLCDRCVVLDQGHVIANCRPDELMENQAVVAAYLGMSGARKVDAAAQTSAGREVRA